MTDRLLGRTQQANENLAAGNKELDRHAEIDSNNVSVDAAYADLGLSDGEESGSRRNSVPKIPKPPVKFTVKTKES